MGFAPHQIPAFLEQDWYERFIRPTKFPADAAAHLVCRSAQCTLREATLVLGIPPGSVRDEVNDDAFWKGAKDAPIDFRFAVVGLGTHLREIADYLPDYQRRRDILSNWVLPEETWRELADPPPRNLWETSRPRRPETPDRLHLHLAARHRREHLFAPRPLEQARPELIRRAWAARRPTTRGWLGHGGEPSRRRPHWF
ncbi:hypothetical protein ACIA74_18850 [Streptomyces sp. NPDC051658]|uniref:hypothetical protein n=1 Tax=Streptomyces sp. NPDC051658 TaxID=3365667 RepID=UPI003794B569